MPAGSGFVRCLGKIWHLYADGFRDMTWGRPLWGLIILKLVILFAVLRVFFFQPVLAGKTDGEKSDYVGSELIDRAGPATYKE